MNRTIPPIDQSALFVEALEPRIAPAGLLNESKFTSVVVGGSLLLDASDPNGFQGLTTGFGANSGAYLLYVTAGKALVYTSDLNGNGKFDFGEITGIAAGVDSQGRSLDLIAFTDINGDIVTNLLPGLGVSALTDSDNNPANGRDGRVLLNNGIHSITLRTLTAADIDTTIAGNTVANRLALTSFSIHGNIYTGGDFGAEGAGLTIDTGGNALLGSTFNGDIGSILYRGSTPQIGSIKTGTAAGNEHFHFTNSSGVDVQGTLLPFAARAGQHGSDIIGVHSTDAAFDVGTLETGAGGLGARGGNLSEIVLNGDRGGYRLIAGDGGQGATGATGGSIINFTDLGSVTSAVFIHSGSGGAGLLGAGGQGGTVTFSTASITANLRVVLGDGGNGFTAGGDGASQNTAVFTPLGTDIVVGGKLLGTYHEIGDVGNMRLINGGGVGSRYTPRVIDFDGDGFGDAIYTTSNPDQLVVLFGNGSGQFFDNTGALVAGTRTIYLDAPGASSNSVVVADFNGDGRPDIAAASGVGNSFGGIYLFLNQIGDSAHNPLGGRLYTGNPLGNKPFSDPLQSPLPALVERGVYQGASPIRGLTAGDFNGDGIMDIGLVNDRPRLGSAGLTRFATVLFGDDMRDPNTGQQLRDANSGKLQGSGFFFANAADAGQPSVLQVINVGGAGGPAVLKTSALTAVNGQEALFYGTPNGSAAARVLTVLGVTADPVTHVPFTANLTIVSGGTVDLGQVDTNPLASTPTSPQVSLQNVTLQDFALQDLDADGNVDVVVLSATPTAFLVPLQGTGVGGFGISSNPVPPVSVRPGDNFGINFGLALTGSATSSIVSTAIVPVDFNQDGIFNQVAVLLPGGLDNNSTTLIQELSLQDNGGAPSFNGLSVGSTFITSTGANDPSVRAFDAYYAQANVFNPATGYGVIAPNVDNRGLAIVDFFGPDRFFFPSFTRSLTDNGIRVDGGRGGDAVVGNAGAGGSVGTTLTATADGGPNGSIRIVIPSTFGGAVVLAGGDGGNGFGAGGNGGDAKGISVRGAGANAVLFGGDGGNGVSGDGGRGGNLRDFTIVNGSNFAAGNGGTGFRGGAGGSIIGNTAGFFDTVSFSVTTLAGFGGTGALGGGAGGSITNFNAIFAGVQGGGGSLQYTSGAGGSAAAGAGGNGGGILNSSPNSGENNLSGVLLLLTGAGGDGLTGGDGGAITNFVNQPTIASAVPTILSATTGNGGVGVVNRGGVGGEITNFQSNAIGFAGSAGTGLVRLIAGEGGASYGNVGGVGGNIVNSTSQAISTQIVAAAGVGGAGLTAGGNGGSVTNAVINSAAQNFGKVLVVAGAGGDASSLLPEDVQLAGSPADLAHTVLAFGGASGQGGNGGNITNFTQPVSVQTAVDLIAGNGGSTVSYGNSLNTTSGVGKGGSVVGANLAGSVGASSRDLTTGINPPIRSYTDIDNNGVEDISIAQFVSDFLLNGGLLNNTVGNVGIVAGISGRVLNNQPPRDGVNGSVQNITASSIMSIVAGSVDRVAPVQTVSGLQIRGLEGVLGADKSLGVNAIPNNRVEYFNEVGAIVSNLQPGFRLIDGAIYAQNIIQPAVPPLIQGPRVFVTAQG